MEAKSQDVVMEDSDLFEIIEDPVMQENARVFTEDLLELKKEKEKEENPDYDEFDQFRFKYNDVKNPKFEYVPASADPPDAGETNTAAGYDGYDDIELDFQISDRFNSMNIGNPTNKLYYALEDLTDLPRLALRDEAPVVDPSLEDFLFQVSDVTIGKDLSTNEGREAIYYIHGNTQRGHTVVYQYRGYKPFFYLSMPELGSKEKEQEWADALMQSIRENEPELPFDELYDYTVEYKLPTVGFRNGKKMPVILFQYRTTSAFYKFRDCLNKLFPPPNEEQVKNGDWKEKNKVVLCDAYSKEEMKFCDWIDIGLCGWVRLRKGTYLHKPDISYAQYTFTGGHVEAVYDKENIAPVLIDSFDIETIRADGANAMPNPTNLDDHVATIAHAIRPSDRSQETYYISFSWGGDIKLPTHDRKTNEELPKRNIILRNYKNEAEMLVAWVRWRRSTQVSPDVTIGWNIYGFDLGYIATRIRILQASYNIPDDVKEWGRLIGYETAIKESKIQSKAIAFNQYKLTPSPGNVFIDSLILYQRDVTLRLTDYHLQTVSKYFLKEGKTDVHYSEIKRLFFGTPEERGYLIFYNVQDCDLVLRLFFHSGHWPKSVNVSRVNRVLLNLLCPRGQQIRVFGGFHYVAHKRGYFVYRPHYHPILDAPIVEEDSAEAEYLSRKFEKKGDNESMIEYYMRILSQAKLAPKVTLITNDKDGNQTSKVLEEGGMEILNETNSVSTKKTHGQLFDVGEGVEIYKPDEKRQKTDANKKRVFRFANGKTTTEVEEERKKNSRRNPNRKLVKGADGKLHEVFLNRKKKDSETIEKGFSGGFVMEPEKGFFRNVPILDFNALYPNIMMSYCLDPALLVLDEEFANCPGVNYLEIRFSDTCVFRFAQGQPGVMIEHTRNLVNSRKIAQGVMNSYSARMDYSAAVLKNILESSNDKFDDLVAEAEPIVKKGIKSSNDARSKAVLLHAFEGLLDGEKEILFDLFNTFLEYNYKADAKPETKELCEWMKERLKLSSIEDVIDTATQYLEKTKDPIHKDIIKFVLSTIQTYLEKIVELRNTLEEAGYDLTITIDPSQFTLEEKLDAIAVVLGLCVTYKSDHTNYNSKQNELKVGSNSTFGFLGAGGQFSFTKDGQIMRRGMMPVSPVSACVTYIGRKTIERSKNYVETKYPGTRVIYADTDSLFILFPKDLISADEDGFLKTFDLAPQVAKEISALFQFAGSTMKIVHEKTAKFLIMYSAKCYALDKYESKKDKGKLEVKGLSFSKRDCCKFVANTLKTALDFVLRQGDLEGAKNHVRQRFQDLIDGKIPLEELAIYQKLSKSTYEEGQKVAHALLAQKIDERNPGLGPKSGESVKYLYVNEYELWDNTKKKVVRQKLNDWDNKMEKFKKIEDFQYTVDKGLQIDKYWYIANQGFKNVCTVFEPLMKDPASLVRPFMATQKRQQMGIKNSILDSGIVRIKRKA